MPENGWILESGRPGGCGPTCSYNIRHRDFKIIYGNVALQFVQRFDRNYAFNFLNKISMSHIYTFDFPKFLNIVNRKTDNSRFINIR